MPNSSRQSKHAPYPIIIPLLLKTLVINMAIKPTQKNKHYKFPNNATCLIRLILWKIMPLGYISNKKHK